MYYIFADLDSLTSCIDSTVTGTYFRRTPGHTKHFQTIFLTKSVKLCDCPGLGEVRVALNLLLFWVGTYAFS